MSGEESGDEGGGGGFEEGEVGGCGGGNLQRAVSVSERGKVDEIGRAHV